MPCFSLRKSLQLLSLGLVPCMEGHEWSVSFRQKVISVTPNERRFYKTKARKGGCLNTTSLFGLYYTNASEQGHIKTFLNGEGKMLGEKKTLAGKK